MGEQASWDRGESVRLLIRGRVQGVGFRAWARRLARELGVRGWIRNRADGSVEVSAAGPAEALDHFRRGLDGGPGPARVEEVVVEGDGIDLPGEGFEIRY